MGARQRQEIVLAEQAVRLLGDRANDVGEGYAPLEIFGKHVPPRIGRGLKADAGHPGTLKAILHDRADLVVVDSGMQRRHQDHADPRLTERLDGSQLLIDEPFAAEEPSLPGSLKPSNCR